MKIIGITGGTGAGKTTALKVLQGYGALIIDCDELYKRLLQTDKAMCSQILSAYPEALGTDGSVDRKKLGKIVFSDEGALKCLNSITHLHVKKNVEKQLLEGEHLGKKLAAVDAIGLIESGLASVCDITVAVTAPEEKRIRRIEERDGISFEYASLRSKAQRPESFFRENCDYVLENNADSQEEFVDICKNFFNCILKGQV